MSTLSKYRWPQIIVILAGAITGLLSAVLQYLGNPKNMGFCIACMERDIVGALGLHRTATAQYLRPEIPGLIFGAFVAALIFREFRARTGSSPILRFVLGFFTMVGALVFLGCPWRALFRLAGGDWNALVGLAGLATGVFVGVLFLKSGFDLGRSYNARAVIGWVPIISATSLTILAFTRPTFAPGGPIFTSHEGPGSSHAPILVSLGIAFLVGFLIQRSRLCTIGSFRDLFLMRDFYLTKGILSLVVIATIVNFILHQFKPGFIDQPVAHTVHIWNFGGLFLVGLACTLGGGCPARQLVLSAEGDSDATFFVLGMFAGAAFSHNMAASSSSSGVGPYGPASVVMGIVVCLSIGLLMRER